MFAIPVPAYGRAGRVRIRFAERTPAVHTTTDTGNAARDHRALSRPAVWIALTGAVWLTATWLFWVGYTGEDDLFYARYAFLFHRPPIVWWEFRIPAILAIRGSFLAFGPSELAAALPSLLASAAIMGSVAWFVGWPRRLTWQSQSAMLLAALIPIDVAFRSYPSAPQVAAGLLAAGTVLLVKGGRRAQVISAALLATAFATHEISFFYVALLCLTALAFDHRRYFRAVLWCVLLSGAVVMIEAVAYWALLGDPLARLKTSAGSVTALETGVDTDTGLSGVGFFAWPLQNLVLAKQFGFNLLALLLTGIVAWRRLTLEQRILFTTTFATFLWLGYGSLVPWAYKPLYRQYHYYNSITLGITALLPFTLAYALAGRTRIAQTIVAMALLVHVGGLAAGGRWGAPVDVSRDLLAFAQERPAQRFVTDVNTFNQMYMLNGFRVPDNVGCLNGQSARNHLVLNKEPAGVPRFRCAEGAIDAILINREQRDLRGFEREFSEYVDAQAGPRVEVAPVQYRLAFAPLARMVEPRNFMIRSAGGEAIVVSPAQAADWKTAPGFAVTAVRGWQHR